MLARRTEMRPTEAHKIRAEAADYEASQPHPEQVNNGEELQYRTPTPMALCGTSQTIRKASLIT